MNEACFVFEVAPAGTVLKGFLHYLLYYFRVNRQFCNALLPFKYPPLFGSVITNVAPFPSVLSTASAPL